MKVVAMASFIAQVKNLEIDRDLLVAMFLRLSPSKRLPTDLELSILHTQWVIAKEIILGLNEPM